MKTMTFNKKNNSLQRHHEIKARKGQVFQERYRNICTLGKGNFGKVFLAEDLSTGDQVAIKVVDKRLFKNSDQKQHAQREKSICEDFAIELKHKNIVQIFDVVSDEECIFIVMEYVQGGELFDRIKQDQKLTEQLARRWFREIVEAVCYIHENGIVHRDLKPENVLIDKKQRVRVCDFGFGKRIHEREEVLSTYCGSPFYAAPEMVTATPYKGPPVDMWSCGVILYAMLTGTLPFQGEDMPQLFRKISQGLYNMPRFISSDAAHLINRLLCKNSKDRITAAACLDHPWLRPPTITTSSASSSSIRKSVLLSAATLSSKHTKGSSLSSSTSTHKQKPLLDKKPTSPLYSTSLSDLNKHNQPIPFPSDKSSAVVSNADIPPTSYSKKIKGSAPFRFVYPKKYTQVMPASEKLDQKTPQKKYRAAENKMIHRFKGFFKSAFQKRIT